MSSASYNRDTLTDSESDMKSSRSEVASFYAERNILLTGGSGFLGKLLIEKILRSCSNVNKLYLLLREKKGKAPEERFKEIFNDVLFDRLEREQPGYTRKVILIAGDIMQVGLGLSAENRELLRSANIVIHGAATVRFDEKLRIAANINVRGTRELLLLAKEMVDLKAFVHISTAYSNCVNNEIDEIFYAPPMDSGKLLDLLDILDDSSLEHLTLKLLGRWPNTYAFTKAIAEDTVRRYGQDLPFCIVRPSIVMATSQEPIAGWINNVYGPTGILVGAAAGVLRTLHCDQDLVADMIPADYVVNTVIAAAWDTARTQTIHIIDAGDKISPKGDEPRIYNVVSSPQSPITWSQLMKYTEKCGMEVPSATLCLWYYCFTLNKYRWVHNLFVVFLHLIPAALVDSLARLTGRKPMLWAAYKKIHKFSDAIEYFTLQQWRFHNNNVKGLWNELSSVDRSLFDFDMTSFSWAEYSYRHIRGIRVYLLKDPLDTVPQGLAKYAKLKIAHYTLVTALCGLLLWMLWAMLRFFISS